MLAGGISARERVLFLAAACFAGLGRHAARDNPASCAGLFDVFLTKGLLFKNMQEG